MGKIMTEKVTRKLLVCPSCFARGQKQVLGEIDEDGSLIVLRHHKSGTKIISDAFAVACDSCGEVAFFRKKNNGR